jgi:hypothetical protein
MAMTQSTPLSTPTESRARRSSALESALAPLAEFLDDPHGAEIMVNADGSVWVEWTLSRMNRPSPSDFVLGHRAGGVVFVCVAFYSLFLWANQVTPWFVPVLVILLGRHAHHARVRVQAYREWSQAWNAMAGIPPEQQGAGKRSRQRAFNVVGGSMLWLILAGWLLTNPNANSTLQYACFAGIFGLVSLWGAGAALLPIARWMFRRGGSSTAKRARVHIVTVCLPVPRTSPRPAAIAAALPAYARALLARQNDAPAATSGDARHASSP